MKTVLQVLSTIFLVIYTYGVVMGIIYIFSRETGGIVFEDIFVVLLYLLFFTGYMLSWKKEHAAGTIYFAWYAGSFILGLFIAKEGAGMELALGIPAILIGAMYILLGFRKNFESVPATSDQWNHVLSYFSMFYLAVYLMFAFSGQMGNRDLDLFRFPGILLFVPMALFFLGYVYTWIDEKKAGFLYISCYVVILLLSFIFKEIAADGYIFMYAIIGLAILLHGVLYLNIAYRILPQEEE